jgi:hypothetical protein
MLVAWMKKAAASPGAVCASPFHSFFEFFVPNSKGISISPVEEEAKGGSCAAVPVFGTTDWSRCQILSMCLHLFFT